MKNYNYDDDPLLASCGISIEKQFAQVDGRVLEAPKVNIHFILNYTTYLYFLRNVIMTLLIFISLTNRR